MPAALFASLLLCLALLAPAGAAAATEAYFVTQLTSNGGGDYQPQVSGDRVVWTGYGGTDSEIFTWTPESGTVQLTSNSVNDHSAKVSGDRVVWVSSLAAGEEIYTWTPAGGTQRVTNNTWRDYVPQVSGDRIAWYTGPKVMTWTPGGGIAEIPLIDGFAGGWPELSGDRVAWVGMYGVHSEAFTWTPTDGTVRLTTDGHVGEQAVVSGDRVVWLRTGAVPMVVTWTPSGGIEQIASNQLNESYPAVSGDRIVWHANDGTDRDIFTWTPTGGTVQLTKDTYQEERQVVSGDRVAWIGRDSTDYEVFAWTPAGGTVKLTANSRDEMQPQISGDRIVWAGHDGTDYEIFTAAAYPVTVPAVTTVAPASGPTSGGTSVVITGSGFLGLSGASAVTFGGVNSTNYVVNSPTKITATAPAHTAGVVDVVVTAAGGASDPTGHTDDFTYIARYQQSDTRLAYRGSWTASGAVAASGGSFRFTASPGASVTIVFEGTYFAWIAKKSPVYGIAKVTVDGDTKSYTLLDLFSFTPVYREKVYELNVPAGGVHTVVIECTGSKNPGASGTNISIDAFDIIGNLLQAPVINRYEQGEARLAYTGVWTASSAASASGGSFRFANSSGSSVTIPFSGTSLSWLAKKSPVYGIAKVTVDGGASSTVDLYDAGTLYQRNVWDTGKLANGLHTVKIQWTGDKSQAATGTNISADAFDVLGTLVAATRFEQTDSHLGWGPSTSAWTTSNVPDASGSSFRFANSSGAKVSIKFTGVKLDIVAKKSPLYGIASIRLDGGDPIRLDLYSTTAVYKQRVWSTGFLVPGDHTVTIEWTGSKRAAATGTYINLDAVDLIGVLR